MTGGHVCTDRRLRKVVRDALNLLDDLQQVNCLRPCRRSNRPNVQEWPAYTFGSLCSLRQRQAT